MSWQNVKNICPFVNALLVQKCWATDKAKTKNSTMVDNQNKTVIELNKCITLMVLITEWNTLLSFPKNLSETLNFL